MSHIFDFQKKTTITIYYFIEEFEEIFFNDTGFLYLL